MEVSAELIQKINNYHPNQQTVELVKTTPILLLVGIAGAGKDTIKQRLFAEYPQDYHHIVSHTTRPPRENHGVLEQDGVAYHFISRDQAEEMIDAQAFVEAKLVHQSDVYGTSSQEIQTAHNEKRIAITDLEVKGVAEYEAMSSDVKAVFILPPSYDIWQERLLGRYDGEIDPIDLKKRMNTAYHEIAHALSTDYFYLVINDNLHQAVDRVNAIAHNQPIERRPQAELQVAQDILAQLANQLTH